MELKELQARMTKAIEDDNTKLFEKTAQEIIKSKADRHKAEVAVALKESEQLAGKREALATEIGKAVHTLGLEKSLASVKSKGFTFTIDHKENEHGAIDLNGSVTVKGGCALIVPAIKAKKTGGGNGGTGKTKEEFGMTLDEAYEAHVDSYSKAKGVNMRAKFAEAEAADLKHAEEHGFASPKQSNRWRVKDVVKKWALAEGLLAPRK